MRNANLEKGLSFATCGKVWNNVGIKITVRKPAKRQLKYQLDKEQHYYWMFRGDQKTLSDILQMPGEFHLQAIDICINTFISHICIV